MLISYVDYTRCHNHQKTDVQGEINEQCYSPEFNLQSAAKGQTHSLLRSITLRPTVTAEIKLHSPLECFSEWERNHFILTYRKDAWTTRNGFPKHISDQIYSWGHNQTWLINYKSCKTLSAQVQSNFISITAAICL